MNVLTGIVLYVSICVCSLLLHICIPSHVTYGYCCDNVTRKPLVYNLNGFLMLCTSTAIFLLLPLHFKLALYDHYREVSLAACVLGIVMSQIFYVRGGRERYVRCLTVDQLDNVARAPILAPITVSRSFSSFLSDFFLGLEFNPRYLTVYNTIDVKMFLYALGAILLQLNNMSFLYHHLQQQQQLSTAFLTYFILFTWFTCEYMLLEKPHLYTYDIFAEKIGFKLIWGCMCFYPQFYPLNGYVLCDNIDLDSDISCTTSHMISALFFIGWIITRGANMQKYYFKRYPNQRYAFCGLVEQVTLPNTKILISGFWGCSRHLNYLGEIIQAVAISLPLILTSFSRRNGDITLIFMALSYPLYYICLFIPRQLADEEVCRRKYGKVWKLYEEKVKYRIIPFVY